MMNRQISRCWLVLIVSFIFSAAQAETFTIAVLPDTQHYTMDTVDQPESIDIFKGENQFIADNRTAMNIVFVSHVGDIIQSKWYYPNEWSRAREAMNILRDANMPMGIVPGNHDYDHYVGDDLYGTTYWNYFFGPSTSYFYGKSWYGGACINSTDTSGTSSWQVFSAGGMDFLHIAFELEPSDDVLAWASSVIAAHPGYRVIVTMHAYMSSHGTRYTTSEYRMSYPHNTAQEVWDEFIKTHSQIFMVLCGHSYGAYRRVDFNNSGGKVWQIVSDYQSAPSDDSNSLGAGGGWLRLMEFDTDSVLVRVHTYSSLFGKYSNDPCFTDGSSYARRYAPFNYADDGAGALLPSSNSASSDFNINIDPMCKIGEQDGDFNGDCLIDFKDFAVIAGNWLYCGSTVPGVCDD